MRIVILHKEFGLEAILCITFESDNEHGCVLGTIVIDRLSAFECLDHVKEFADETTMRHSQNFDISAGSVVLFLSSLRW